MENKDSNFDESKLIKQVSAPLFSSRRWMKFVGIMLIVTGVVYAISIIGLLLAWIPIWLGIILISAANRLEVAYTHSDKYSFIEAQTKVGSYFTIFGVLMLIGLVLTVVTLGIMVASGFLIEYMTNIEHSL